MGWIKKYEKLRARASSIDLLFPGHEKHYPIVGK
jgi:hypothetical protein